MSRSGFLIMVVLCSLIPCVTTMHGGVAADKVCLGSDYGITHGHSDQPLVRYHMYRRKYQNCTYVDGNLEIVFLDGDSDYDMSFLQDIQEVTGYVLILSCYSQYIPLTSLRVIRGRSLFHGGPGLRTVDHDHPMHTGYSLYVAYNYKPGSSTIGLKELQLTSLHEIMSGDVMFYNNSLLCFENTINWPDIQTGENTKAGFHEDSKDPTRTCGQCHENCTYQGDRHCWGEGAEMCQTLTRLPCARQCDGRCYGPEASQCCYTECAGGCSGPTKYDCWDQWTYAHSACKNFKNGDKCEAYCPPEFIYDPRTYRKVPNPNARYSYGSICVKQCPAHLIADRGSCVGDCGQGRMAGPDRKCVDCNGPCPKTCSGTASNDFINAENIKNFTGCTVIQGGLRILPNTFLGDTYRNLHGINSTDLSVFDTVQEITDYLQVQASHEQLKNLSFLKNLRIIHGRVTDSIGASLHIFGSSLESLNLQSLERINNGHVFILSNPSLCFVDSIKWSNLIATPEYQNLVVTDNANSTYCADRGLVCSKQCTLDGCFGSGDDQCLSCAMYRYAGRCLESCDRLELYTVNGTKECGKCHEECSDGCYGSGADECMSCRTVQDGPYCVSECPSSKYPNETGHCEPCHPNCDGGCTGPLNAIGPGACNSCELVLLDQNNSIVKCLLSESECELGYHKGMTHSAITQGSLKACIPCYEECLTCSGPGLSFCTSCKHYRQDTRCVANCSQDYYPDPLERLCLPCDPLCIHCTGPTTSDCIACKHIKVYQSHYNNPDLIADEEMTFNCTDRCPDALPHKATSAISGDVICVATSPAAEDKKQIGVIIGVVAACVMSFGVIVLPIVYMRRQWARAEENKLRLTARMSGLEDSEGKGEPLAPSDAKPDMSNLRLIKESEIRRGNIIGSGAFGTVYKGIWIPDGENVKIPVAIKVLQEGTTPGQNKELLEEARIMTSVVHPCCIRIIAVCMTVQMMLITQLMPLGCLLDYVRNNRMNICSKVMLNWGAQIARGMAYLEGRGIVHRDLAARNVLVQSPYQVKITDFGLAKLLDYNEDEFYAGAGKMPIKWLALESILHRVFTHKSDVWSFGVTMWEIFTYGQRPYENIRAQDISDLLEKGERLSQPAICTIDVYMIMIKCWMLDAMSRPAFKELADEFTKMARDPGRYLVIPGDKLMRLPSYSYDTLDLVRTMSICEGPEQVITAEEYFHNPGGKLSAMRNYNNNGALNSTACHINGALELSSITDDDSHSHSSSYGRRSRSRPESGSCFQSDLEPPRWLLDESPEPLSPIACRQPVQVPSSLNPEGTRGGVNYGQRGFIYNNTRPTKSLKDNQTTDNSNISRTVNNSNKGVIGNGCAGKENPARKDEGQFRLHLDEDDYLQPKLSKLPTYLELISDQTDYAETSPVSYSSSPGFPSSSTGPTVVSNPEYFEGSPYLPGPQGNRGDLTGKLRESRPIRLRSESTESSTSDVVDSFTEFDRLNEKRHLTNRTTTTETGSKSPESTTESSV